MRQEFSFGILPLKRIRKKWHVLLILHGKGHWAFPKGHGNPGEEAKETAERELEEETHLTISYYLSSPPYEESYFFQDEKISIHKTVVYFAAVVKGKVKVQQEEISDYKWISVEQAADWVTFAESRRICLELSLYLQSFPSVKAT